MDEGFWLLAVVCQVVLYYFIKPLFQIPDGAADFTLNFSCCRYC